MDLMKEIKELKQQNEEKEKRTASLECRVADLEQYTHMNDIVVSGLETKPRPTSLTEPDKVSFEQQVTAFFHGKGIAISNTDIEVCHPLPQKNKSEKPAIIISFTNRKHKQTAQTRGNTQGIRCLCE